MMTSTIDQDPFIQVQADVLSQLNQTRSLFKSYLRIRSLALSAPSASPFPSAPTSSLSSVSPELLSARSDLESSLSTLAEDLTDLIASVRAVELDPYKYGLEIEEVMRRKRLVDEVGGEVDDMREELQKSLRLSARRGANPSASAAAVSSSNGVGLGIGTGNAVYGYGGAAGQGEEEEALNGDSYAEFEHQQQLRLMSEQDSQLEGVFHTVGNLRQQADTMGRELEEQAEMLEVVDGLADRVGGRLQTGLKKMGTIVKKNEDGLSSCCIGLLILVLIILLVLVLII